MPTNIGTGPQDIPLNQFLGEMAFIDKPLTSELVKGGNSLKINASNELVWSSSSPPTIRLSNSDGSISADQIIGAIEFKSNDGSGDGSQVTGSIESISQAAFTGQGSPSHLIFKTNGESGANALKERFRIKSNGDLKHTGLRSGGGDNKLAILVTPSHNTNEEDVIVYQVENESSSNQITFGGGTASYNAATKLLFKTASGVDTTGGTERLSIVSTGQLNVNQANTNNLQGQVTIFEGTDFSSASQGGRDNIYLISDQTSANGGYGSSIAWSRIQYADRRAAAIANVQTSSDEDQVGLAFFTHPSTVADDDIEEKLRITHDGNIGVNITDPSSRLHVRDSIFYGKDSYASAATSSSQTPPPGTFKWENSTDVNAIRGYKAWIQSGDAFPNASTYIDVMIRNAQFYRITIKRSNSSVDAAVATMLIYGLNAQNNTYKPVVYISGCSGHTGAPQHGHGYLSNNAVATFYWEVVSHTINTNDCIIRINTNSSNNQGIIALIENI